MFTDDEKDYIMRMIKEIARVLASVMLGKKYVQVELPVESKYQISGDKLYHMKTMVDRGEINEAENELLDRIDYADKEALAEAMFFYEYAASKGDEFLEAHNYSLEEIRDGIQQLAEDAGYGNIMAYAEDAIHEKIGKPVLSSPRFGAQALAAALKAKGL